MKRTVAVILSFGLLVTSWGGGAGWKIFQMDDMKASAASRNVIGEDHTAALRKESISSEEIKESLDNGVIIDEVSKKVYKTPANANPISSSVFCADPTSVEYEGRLYVYGTNDHQQSEEDTTNDYDQIKSLVVFSTDDMTNWLYHGRIEVGEVAPWITNSWAPSIVSRVEEDGLTHFYLYFSNSGGGVGVITSTDPVGPWSDPLGKPLVYQNMPGLKNCPAPFDPGVCIDENGVGWLTFGGGTPAAGGDIHTNVPKIVKLGADMLSFDSNFVSIDAPYFFEASELNYVDGYYYYTYCNNWQDRGDEWDYDGIGKPPKCSMAYLVTKTPLDAGSWEYKGAYFYNSGQNPEGESGLRWGNNHTHFCTFQGVNYIIHHTMLLEELMGGSAGFRSLMADYLPMDASAQEIPIRAATRKGVSQIKAVDAYSENSGASLFTSADVFYDKVKNPAAKSMAGGAWTMVKGVDFEYGADQFIASVKGKGRLEVRLDDIDSEPVSYIAFDNDGFAKVRSASVKRFEGRNHNVFFVFSGEGIEFGSWAFTRSDEEARPAEDLSNTDIQAQILTICGQVENPGVSLNTSLEFTKVGDYTVKSSSFDAGSEVLNLGYITTDEYADYYVNVRSLTLETEKGEFEIAVNRRLDPRDANANGLANGWGGAKVGDLIYGSDEAGLFAEKTTFDWIGYRIALKIDGSEIPYTSITYNISIEENLEPVKTPGPTKSPKPTVSPKPSESPEPTGSIRPIESLEPAGSTQPMEPLKPTESIQPTGPMPPTESSNPGGKPGQNVPSETPAVKVAKVKVKKLNSPRAGTIRLKWIKDKQADGYQVETAQNRKFTKSVKRYDIRKNKTTSKTIGKLKKGKVYYVRIRGYRRMEGMTYRGSWGKILKVKCR